MTVVTQYKPECGCNTQATALLFPTKGSAEEHEKQCLSLLYSIQARWRRDLSKLSKEDRVALLKVIRYHRSEAWEEASQGPNVLPVWALGEL